MKVYIAKDWTGAYVFEDVPKLEKCGGLPPIWTGHKLPYKLASDVINSIPRGNYLERDIWWSIVRLIK